MENYVTEAILLSKINYSESSLIISCLTEDFGLQKFFLKGARKSKRRKSNNFHQLSIIEISGKSIKNAGLQHPTLIKPKHSLLEIVQNIEKISIAFFLSEVLSKTISIADTNTELYSFVKSQVLRLDSENIDTKLFPHKFLIELSGYLGFGLTQNSQTDLKVVSSFSQIEEFTTLRAYLGTSFDRKAIDHRRLLDEILKYFGKQIDAFGQLKSLEVIKEVLS